VNYLLVLLIIFTAVCAFFSGRYSKRKVKFDGTLEVTQDSKSIFTFDLDIEPEELATRDHISIKVVRTGPPVS
jgi:hypothetical protein